MRAKARIVKRAKARRRRNPSLRQRTNATEVSYVLRDALDADGRGYSSRQAYESNRVWFLIDWPDGWTYEISVKPISHVGAGGTWPE